MAMAIGGGGAWLVLVVVLSAAGSLCWAGLVRPRLTAVARQNGSRRAGELAARNPKTGERASPGGEGEIVHRQTRMAERKGSCFVETSLVGERGTWERPEKFL